MSNKIDIIPAIDLLDGDVVRLYQGDYNKQKNYSNDWLSLLSNYVNQGARFLHLVDLSGARNPKQRQINLINKIIQVIDAKIQVGGGIRSQNDVKNLLDIGASKVVIGSNAVNYPFEVKNWFKKFGYERFVLSLDINVNKNNQKKVAIHGWQEQSNKNLEEVIDYFVDAGLKYVLCTDISKDGTMQGANINLYNDICNRYPNIYFQASGGINSLNDISLLKQTKVKGLIIGRSLLEGVFSLREALLHVS